jgi:phosphodiesterase/alkaline phosphatase D-like protein
MTPKAEYSYTVQSGGKGAKASKKFTFRAPYSDGVTKIALYGDMGVYTWNNMQNLYEDVVVNQTADLIIHAGDHCYNEGDMDEKRADAVKSPAICLCVWCLDLFLRDCL